MGVEARIECGWIPSLQHGNGVFDGIDLVLDSQMHLKAFFLRGERAIRPAMGYDASGGKRQYLFKNEGNGGRALVSSWPARLSSRLSVRQCQLCVNALRYTPKGL